MLKFTHNPTKAAQAAYHLLRGMGGWASRSHLSRLLFLAERTCLVDQYDAMIGDQVVVTAHGFVLAKTTASLLTANPFGGHLNGCGDAVRVQLDPGVGKLNRGNLRVLEQLAEKYRYSDDLAVCEAAGEVVPWESIIPPDRAEGAWKNQRDCELIDRAFARPEPLAPAGRPV